MESLSLDELGGYRPGVQDGTLFIHDDVAGAVYAFGGIPWKKNEDTFSETMLPTAGFYKLDIFSRRWFDISVCFHFTIDFQNLTTFNLLKDATLLTSSDRFPFVNNNNTGLLSKPLGVTDFYAELQRLPALANAQGTLYHHPYTETMNNEIIRQTRTYLILFGGFGTLGSFKTYTGIKLQAEGAYQLICVDLTDLSWCCVHMKGNKFVRRRVKGSMIVVQPSEDGQGPLLVVVGGLTSMQETGTKVIHFYS